MSGARLALPPFLTAWSEPLRATWRQLPPREQRLVWLMAALLGGLLLWLLALQPAWRTVRDAPAQISALESQLQAMQRAAGEARELRAAPALTSAQSAEGLSAASARLGDKGKLSLQGERAVLTLSGVSSQQLRAWLAEARSGARARPVEAQLMRGPQGYSGTVIVAVGGKP